MSKRQGVDTGDFLYRYFRKRNSSFLFNIYKAGITVAEDDIHKSRVDLKKIFALIGFFEMIGTDLFDLEEPGKIFERVFDSAGRIREIQMDLLYLENLKSNDPGIHLFAKYLKTESKKEMRRFINSIIRFDEKKLNQVNQNIKDSCKSLDRKKIKGRCDDFFHHHSAMIRKFRGNPDETENIHKIRKEMKKISSVADLLSQLRTDKVIKKLIRTLSKAELLIGDWHDRVILQKSIDSFLQVHTGQKDIKFDQLENVKRAVAEETQSLLKQLLPEVDKVVILIAAMPFLRKA
jgi:CHAD domain-containing protein